ncbi:hypothetical protein ACJJTC_007085 [Scirpophaga incertulas]
MNNLKYKCIYIYIYRVGHMSVGDLILQFLGNAGRGAAEGMLLAASLPGNLVAMEPYTGAQRAFCVRAYYENNKSVITARRLYRHEHGLRDLSGVPSANVIRKWIRMFETTGSTISITARGRAVSARSADIVERVRVSVQRNPQQSTLVPIFVNTLYANIVAYGGYGDRFFFSRWMEGAGPLGALAAVTAQRRLEPGRPVLGQVAG